MEASSFADVIRAVRGDLEAEPLSPARLNHAAARIDHLGRRTHGLGWTRDQEIGGCLMAAVRELGRARDLPDAERAESVRQVIRQLEMALQCTDEGLRPQRAAPAPEPAAQEGAHEE